MKKIILSVFAIFMATMAFAEGFGVTGGFTSSQLKLKNIDIKNASGFNIGAVYNMPIGLGFAFQPGLTYNVKGSNWEELKSQAKMGYLEVPLQLQWGLDLVLARPYVFAEPFIGYAVSGSQKILGSDTHSIDLSELKTRFEYGFGLGAGVEVSSRFQVAVKYFWNLEDYDIKEMPGVVSSNIKERASFDGLMLSVAYFF